MKKFTSLFILILVATISFGQSASEKVTKKWRLAELEEFGDKFALTDEQKNDWVEFKSDKHYSGTINNKSIEGTWSEKQGKIYLSKGTKSVFKVNWIKVISLDAKKLVITYQSEDLIKTTLFYTP